MASGRGGGSALLLRLFESSFFNVHLAVSYLKNYADSVGITYYLIRRLAQFPEEEIEFYWPQLCHLLVSRETDSAALEGFILCRCEESTHLAMLTLWFLQASLFDLSTTPNATSFVTCRRVYNKVQQIIFSDPALPDSTLPVNTHARNRRLGPRAGAATLGMSLIAAACAMPALSRDVGKIVVEQARWKHEDASKNGHGLAREDSASDSGSSDDESNDVLDRRRSVRMRDTSRMSSQLFKTATSSGNANSHRQTGSADLTAPLPRAMNGSPPITQKKPPLSASLSHSASLPPRHPSSGRVASNPDLLRKVSSGRLPRARTPVAALVHTSHSASVPVLRSPFSPSSSASLSFSSSSAALASAYLSSSFPKPFLITLLRAHACRSQLDLLTSLQDISTRLVVVPKAARLSALRAELTVLNHGLPRGCCLGMGCNGRGPGSCSQPMPTDSHHTLFSAKIPKQTAHHRIIRISPSEAVVLNSADRAPFLLHVEILEDDLDFDPERRQNSEDLRRVLAEMSGTGFRYSRPFSSTSPYASSHVSLASDLNVADRFKPGVSPASNPYAPAASTSSPPVPPDDDLSTTNDEIDLVEQLYGETSLRQLEGEGDAFEATFQNRDEDERAWLQSDDVSPRRSTPLGSPNPSVPYAHSNAGIAALPDESPQVPPAGARRPNLSLTQSSRQNISLDQYAERMRMAAIMLAQLNASQHFGNAGAQGGGNLVSAGSILGAGLGLGSGIGGAVGAGLEAMRDKLPTFGKSTEVIGQASSGVKMSLDTTTAVSGHSGLADSMSSPASQPALLPSSPGKSSANGHIAARQRVLMPSEAAAIRDKIMSEMMALEEERMERMQSKGRHANEAWTTDADDIDVIRIAVNKEDPSGAMLSESWAQKKSRIRKASPYGHLAKWNVLSVIIKTGADLRQEQLAVQLIQEFGRIWREEKTASWVRYFRILVTSEGTGLIETIKDSVSVHSIKKDAYARAQSLEATSMQSYTLYDHFLQTYGPPSSSAFKKAQTAFATSLASYCIICYLLQIKDRHNGNILIDREGHLIHIDFGFMLSNSPGQIGFEMAPFKLTQDYIEILDGYGSDAFEAYKRMMKACFRTVRKHAERIITLVELMQKESKLPCYSLGDQTAARLRERFQLGLSQVQADEYVERLVVSSAASVFTRLYDTYQNQSQGIL